MGLFDGNKRLTDGTGTVSISPGCTKEPCYQDPFVGEVWQDEQICFSGWNMACFTVPAGWKKFKSYDLGTEHAGETEIFGVWRKNDQFFMYDDIYQPLRDKITKKYGDKSSK
jgi:hypothetical protein